MIAKHLMSVFAAIWFFFKSREIDKEKREKELMGNGEYKAGVLKLAEELASTVEKHSGRGWRGEVEIGNAYIYLHEELQKTGLHKLIERIGDALMTRDYSGAVRRLSRFIDRLEEGDENK